MPRHRLYIDDPTALHEGTLVIGGEEARHAIRVKRLERGEPVEVLAGAGRVGLGRITESARADDGWTLTVAVEGMRLEHPARPQVVVCAATPKGPRLAEMIDGLCQAGAAEWRALRTTRTSSEPREAGVPRLDRLTRIAREASKQCGRAWLLRIGESIAFAESLLAEPGLRVVVADAGGERYAPGGAGTIRLLIGPEGGWTQAELDAARAAGACIARFGPHTMRVETAAVVAAGIVLHAESPG